MQLVQRLSLLLLLTLGAGLFSLANAEPVRAAGCPLPNSQGL